MKPSYQTSEARGGLLHLLLACALVLLILGLSLLIPQEAYAHESKRTTGVFKGKLSNAIGSLKVKPENGGGYDRDAFTHWTDADRDGCDAREEVLIAEATVKPTVGAGCALTGGKWRSYYDGLTTTDPSNFDVDHMVPLAEAFASGAYRWDAATRERYANDLGDKRTLVAVSATSNRSKSDRDPAEWLPKKKKCRYLQEWVAVKVRWSLSVDAKEKKKLKRLGTQCKDVKLRVVKATIGKGQTTPPTTGASTGLRVTAIAYDPLGTDTTEAEVVFLTNVTTAPIQVSGWTLEDEAGTSYTFPTFTIAPGAEVKLHTGVGAQTPVDLWAGRGTSWWNNDGDLFKLYNPSGSLMQVGRYTGAGDGSVARF